MKHFLLFYEGADEYVAKRAKFRAAHLAKAWQASRRGELLLGGAFADPIDGAALLFKGESRRVAEDFARGDPYVTGGVVKRWHVREWTTVVGDQAVAPVQPDSAANSPQATPASESTRCSPIAIQGILRLWKGCSSATQGDDYVRHVTGQVFPRLASIPGHRGAYLLRRSIGNATEFLVLTLWASMEVVRRFAGAEPEKAVVEPAARAALSDFDETVTHYEVIVGREMG